jgi:Tat protein translocase TatC
MADTAGEMPFLDHLEELRKRIIWSVVAIGVGLGAGWWLTTHFSLPARMQAPIAAYIPNGKLVTNTPVAGFMIYLKFALMLGIILASPIVLYQIWSFLAPAMTKREKRAVLPSLGIGLLLFGAGAASGWIWVVGPTVKWLLGFHSESFTTLITWDSYFELVVHIMVGMGVAAELPLVMILLAVLGVMNYKRYGKFRRYAIFLSFIGGAFLSPTPEVVMMLLFTAPLVLLYEIGVAGAYLVERRKLRAERLAAVAGMLLLLFCLTPHAMQAQNLPPPSSQGPPGAPPIDTSRRGITGKGLRSIDSSTAKRLGLPGAPTRTFTPPDSIMQALLNRGGFAATRYMGDSARLLVTEQDITLGGHAATLRDGSQLEAETIESNTPRCRIEARGEPRMFEPGHAALIGVTMGFNSCTERGVIGQAFTSFQELGTNWFIRGNLAVDSSANRVFIATSEFTSCDLPDPHYHFSAREVKWVTQSVIVARPAVLYIRDVPIFWLPFVFQDTKNGRRSGILIPQFGFSDLVRPTRTYNRAIRNVGYYWAPNDYFDATVRLDWLANNYTQLGIDTRYHILNRFIDGDLAVSQQSESSGGNSRTFSWVHNQRFNATTTLRVNASFATNTQQLLQNSVDPLASTRTISSQLTLQKLFRWGNVALGGTRQENLGNGAGSMVFPQLSVTPKSIRIGMKGSWSPSFNVTNTSQFGTPLQSLLALSAAGVDTVNGVGHSRETDVQFNTPIELLGLSLQTSMSYKDAQTSGRRTITDRIPNPENPADSVNVSTIRNADYLSSLDVTTSIGLPVLLHGTWNVTPSIGATNTTSGALFIRSPGSNGQWVGQGKKLQLALASAPTFFGILDLHGGGFEKFRYTLAPLMSIQYSPAAHVSDAYAKALGSVYGNTQTDIPSTLGASVAISQVFEAKRRSPVPVTAADSARVLAVPKIKLLSVNSSPIVYDFEQAKLPGHTGWTTRAITNSFQSDLLQGFQLSMTHDLWQGDAGSDTAKFSPFLSNLQANFSVTARTFRSLGRLVGLGRRSDSLPEASLSPGGTAPLAAGQPASPFRPNAPNQVTSLPRRGFNATLSFSYSRQRPIGTTSAPVSTEPVLPGESDPLGGVPFLPTLAPPPTSTIGLTTSFAPTAFWNVSWTTQYDVIKGTFESQNIQLERDLHDWTARFTFTKAATGNFAVYFGVVLKAINSIKFDYNQTTLQQTQVQQ